MCAAVAVVLSAVVFAAPPEPAPAVPQLQKDVLALEKELFALRQVYGEEHPEVVRAKGELELTRARLARAADKTQGEQKPPPVSGTVFVEVRSGRPVVLRDVQVRTLAGRTFLVGVSAREPGLIKDVTFEGKTIWVPVDEVAQLIELGTPDAKQPGKK